MAARVNGWVDQVHGGDGFPAMTLVRGDLPVGLAIAFVCDFGRPRSFKAQSLFFVFEDAAIEQCDQEWKLKAVKERKRPLLYSTRRTLNPNPI